MPHICPRPCSRLAAAAVYLSIGVVQLIVGIILLRSKYVFLLAGPDFWTSCSNIAVGCLLGVSASVWKNSTKRLSKRHVIRRNVLLALLFSALIINGATLGILLMGEGNAMLSIRLESKRPMTSNNFAKEVLAYAYATSVCAPIICIVVSIVAISGTIFQSPKSKVFKNTTSQSSNLKERAQSFQWVYTPDSLTLQKPPRQDSTSESSSDESSDNTPRQKNISTVEDLHKVMRRMSLGRRNNLLNDSAVMLQQMDGRRNGRHGSSAVKSSRRDQIKPSRRDQALVRARDPAEVEAYRKKRLTYSNQHPLRPSRRSSRGSSGYVTMDRFVHLENRYPDSSPATDDVFDGQSGPSPDPRTFSFQCRNIRENCPPRSHLDPSAASRYPLYAKKGFGDPAVVHKVQRSSNAGEGQSDVSMEFRKLKQRCDAATNRHRQQSPNDVLSPSSTDCFSPDGSDFTDSFDASRSGPWAGEVVPIEVKQPMLPRLRLVPVQSPAVPQRQNSVLTNPKDARAEEAAVRQQTVVQDEDGSLASFRESVRAESPQNGPEFPKVGGLSAKRYELQRMVPMTSISEEPIADIERTTEDSPTSSGQDQELKQLTSSSYPELSKSRYLERNSPGKFKTPKRETPSSKRLRKIWPSGSSEARADIFEQVVDEDSLIGLSEKELIDRQTRTRSIRKVVQQRLREQELVF